MHQPCREWEALYPMPNATTRTRKRILKKADKEFDAQIRYLLEMTTVGYEYEHPSDADSNADGTVQNATRLYEFMVAESYLVRVQDSYMVTVSGRQHRDYLRGNPLTRWFSSHYQWLTPIIVAIAAVLVSVISLIIVAND